MIYYRKTLFGRGPKLTAVQPVLSDISNRSIRGFYENVTIFIALFF